MIIHYYSSGALDSDCCRHAYGEGHGQLLKRRTSQTQLRSSTAARGDAQSEAALSYARHQKRLRRRGAALTPTNILAEEDLGCIQCTGLSYAVVGPSGEIIACEGVGTYNADKTPVSCNDTLFQIASDTKQFTATLALKAEEDGLLSIDEDIRTFWPSFNPPTALSASRTLTLRDAMSHRSGMPRHDNLWQRGDLTGVQQPEDSLRVMQFLDPDKDIRYKSEYTNMMFLVAGEAVAHARNTTWENLLQKEILGPLGMHDAYPTLASVPKDALQRMSRRYDKHAFKILFPGSCCSCRINSIYCRRHCKMAFGAGTGVRQEGRCASIDGLRTVQVGDGQYSFRNV